MTIIGKILTVFLFLFSLIFLGFAVTINQLNKDPQTSKSWYTIVQQYREREKDWQADLRGKNEELASLRAQVVTAANEVKTAKETAAKELEQKNQQIQRVQAEADAVKNKFATVQADLVAATGELDRRRTEATRLYDTIKQKDSEIASLQVEKAEAVNKQTQQTVIASSFQRRNEQLEKLNLDLSAENEDLRVKLNDKRGGYGVAGERKDAVVPVPPPNDVEGVVKQVSPEGLVSISLGSDAGLLKGHTLEVFSLSPTQYKGRITIVEVSPHEAVGRVTDAKQIKRIQPNDKVASRIVAKP